ncbi:MAG: cyclic nucleotide-binding domain-containing protein, partial [Gemmatimonadaceae bacterium]
MPNKTAESHSVRADGDPRSEIAFPRLTHDQVATLAAYATAREVGEGDLLFEAGGSRNAFFVVVSGAVEIIDRSSDEPRTVTVHTPGEFTGDVDLLTQRRPL